MTMADYQISFDAFATISYTLDISALKEKFSPDSKEPACKTLKHFPCLSFEAFKLRGVPF